MATPEAIKEIYQNSSGGTSKYYRHPLVPVFSYTDGVRNVAQEAGAYWFLDILATEPKIMDGMQEHLFAVAVLNVRKETCSNKVARDLDDNTFIEQFFEQYIPYTSFPEGSWKFYLIYGANQITCMLPPEY